MRVYSQNCCRSKFSFHILCANEFSRALACYTNQHGTWRKQNLLIKVSRKTNQSQNSSDISILTWISASSWFRNNWFLALAKTWWKNENNLRITAHHCIQCESGNQRGESWQWLKKKKKKHESHRIASPAIDVSAMRCGNHDVGVSGHEWKFIRTIVPWHFAHSNFALCIFYVDRCDTKIFFHPLPRSSQTIIHWLSEAGIIVCFIDAIPNSERKESISTMTWSTTKK